MDFTYPWHGGLGSIQQPMAWDDSDTSRITELGEDTTGLESFFDAGGLALDWPGFDIHDNDQSFAPSALSSKRAREGEAKLMSNKRLRPLGDGTELNDVAKDIYPELLPSVPDRTHTNGRLDIEASNPFGKGQIHHPKYGHWKETAIGVNAKEVNGLLKFARNSAARATEAPPEHSHFDCPGRRPSMTNRINPPSSTLEFLQYLPWLPAGFGRGFRMSPQDESLLRFYVKAWCKGRTILYESNSFLKDVTSMCSDASVRHAVFALAATYVLDYEPRQSLERLADYHHRQAVQLLGERLNNPENYKPGKENSILATIFLLSHDDFVNWEFRDKKSMPKWALGLETAEKVLSLSDPGTSYEKAKNVQFSNARRHIGGWIAQSAIFSAVTRRLDPTQPKKRFGWLLEGDKGDITRIGAHMGMSPELLHMLGQITHICALFSADPTSKIYPLLSSAIARQLKTIYQWSELSLGYLSTQELFHACDLDQDGKVYDAAKATLVGAEAHAASVRIYLQCRFFRKTRYHPDVQNELRTLIHCIDILPSSGRLFTAQAPFFGVCMAAFVAVRPADRQIVRSWFLTVVGGSRGNVPPAWSGIQNIWKWYDSMPSESYAGDNAPIWRRHAWWEDMVDEFISCEGILTYT